MGTDAMGTGTIGDGERVTLTISAEILNLNRS